MRRNLIAWSLILALPALLAGQPLRAQNTDAPFKQQEPALADPAAQRDATPLRGPASEAPAAQPAGVQTSATELRNQTHAAIPLSDSLRDKSTGQGDKTSLRDRGAGHAGGNPLFTIAGSLFIVLGLFFLSTWVLRRAMPKSSRALPTEVVRVLGRTPLAPRQALQVVAFGKKLVLITVSATGAETLSEITDPVEVDRLLAFCQQEQTAAGGAAFSQLLGKFATERKEARTTERPEVSRRSVPRSPLVQEESDVA